MSWQTQLQVELIDSMGDDLRVANVARVSFDKWKEEYDAKDAKLIDYLAKHEHSSPFRHTAVTVRCSAPIWLARQLGKHQVGMSWNEVSRRYVDAKPEMFEQELRARPTDGIKQGSDGLWHEDSQYEELLRGKIRVLEYLYDEGIRRGIAPETLRGFLPQNMMTSWVWTGSLPSFVHLYNLRSEGTAQKEARVFAEKVKDAVQPRFPDCWDALTG